jgi:hypothetical protein
MNARLTSAGITQGDLLATLPDARKRVYLRRYGKKASGTPVRRSPQQYGK